MRLDKQITLQTKTVTYDNEGMEAEVWTANNTLVFANIQDHNSSQMWIKDFGNSKLSKEFIIFIRPLSGVIEGQRAIYGADSYDIMRVKKWDAHYELICAPT